MAKLNKRLLLQLALRFPKNCYIEISGYARKIYTEINGMWYLCGYINGNRMRLMPSLVPYVPESALVRLT